MPFALTTKTVNSLMPDPAKRLEIPDPALSGLYLVVQPSGAKSWALRYRQRGKPKKLTLGRWPVMPIAAARFAASEALELIESGADPTREDASGKVCSLVDLFSKRHLAQLKSGDGVLAVFQRDVVSRWGDRPVREISRRDVIELLDAIIESGRPVAANRTLAHLSKFFGWLVERGEIDTNPVIGVKKPTREVARDRVLTDDEIRWFWIATERAGPVWMSFARLLLLTGQRRDEVAGMRASEIRGDVWHLDGARTKNGRPHDVPLTEVAKTLLRDPSGAAGYLLTTTGTTPVSGFQKAKSKIDFHMHAVAAEELSVPVEVPHWTFHDLRRTAATGMARLGIPVRVTEAVLNHVSGTGGGIVAVYQRHNFADEKRQALEAWAGLVHEIVEAKVRPIK